MKPKKARKKKAMNKIFTQVEEKLSVIIYVVMLATVYKGNIIKNLIMDCQSYTKYRPNETIMELAIYLLKL